MFNIAEGLHGVSREAQIPAMLEFLQIPYLGSDPLTLALCLDKARAKEVLAYNDVRTASFVLIRSMEDLDDARVRFPLIVKPLHEGSSKGIYNSCVVRNPEELEQEVRTILDTYHEPALVEEFLPGREFTVAILGNGDDIRVLPIVEISFDALARGDEPHLFVRSEVDLGPVGQAAGDLLLSGAPAGERLRTRSASCVCVRTVCWDAATGRASMSVWMRQGIRISSRSIRCRAFCPGPKTIHAFRKRRERRE